MHILELPSFFEPHGGMFCLEQAKALQARGHEVRILSCSQLAWTVDRAYYLKARCGRWTEVMGGIKCETTGESKCETNGQNECEIKCGGESMHGTKREGKCESMRGTKREGKRETMYETKREGGVEVLRTYMRAVPKWVRLNQRRWVRIVLSMYDAYVRKYGKPDVIHAHCAKWAGVAAMAISRRDGIPYFVTEHLSAGLLEEDFGPGWTRHVWAKDLLRSVYHNAACVIPVAAELVDGLQPYFGRDYRFVAVSNIVDTDFFAYQERESWNGQNQALNSQPPSNKAEWQLSKEAEGKTLSKEADGQTLSQEADGQNQINKSEGQTPGSRPYKYCVLARADIYGKGFDVLAEVWPRIKDGELYIAGAGTDAGSFKALFGQDPSVHCLGRLDKGQVRDLLYRCDALVLPSRSEAQPLVLLEAMSTGIPVVSTEVTPACERIANACLIAVTGDSESLYKQMMEVRRLQPSWQISEAVRLIASPEVVAGQLEGIFLEFGV